MAGGSGIETDRTDQRKQWRRWAYELLGPTDRERKEKRKKRAAKASTQIRANTAAETEAKVKAAEPTLLIYTDGGADGNGSKGVWGESGWGAVVYLGVVDADGQPIEIANLYGPIATDPASVWFAGATRGTNQTGEVTGVLQALLFLLHHASTLSSEAAKSGVVVIPVDSLYAINEVEGHWEPNKNADLILQAKVALEKVRKQRVVTFVHVKGHSDDLGNDRADYLVQWGKTSGPYSRFTTGGAAEGDGRYGRLDGHLRKEKAGDDVIRKVLVLGEDQSTTDSAPSESSDGSELSELVARLQLGEEEPAEVAGAETPRGGAAETSFDSEGSTGTVLRYLLESSGERSGEETASEDGAIEPLGPETPRMRALRENLNMLGECEPSEGEGRRSMVLRPNDKD